MDDQPQLSPDQISYLQKLVDTLQSPEPFTDTDLLLENVFSELNSCYLSALTTKESSFLIESLLNIADPSWSVRFTIDMIGQSWPKLLSNPYASRVFDTAMKALKRSTIDENKMIEFVRLFTRSAKQVTELIASPCAAQSLKHLIDMLNSFPSLRKIKIHTRHMFIQHCEIVDVAMTTYGSSFLQFVLLDSFHFDEQNHQLTPENPQIVDADAWIVKNSKEWDDNGGSTEYQLIKVTLTVDDTKFATLVRNQAASHLVEVLLKVSPEKDYAYIFQNRFQGKIQSYIKHPVANFVIQKLIEYCRNQDQFKAIYEEIDPSSSNLLSGRTGVLASLVYGCLKFPHFQPSAIKDLTSSVSKSSDGQIPPSFSKALLGAKNQPLHTFKRKKEHINSKYSPIGCQILSAVFKFQPQHNKDVVTSFVEIPGEELMSIAMDRTASRTFETLFLSKTVSSAQKQELISKLISKEHITHLACDKSGSHVLDKLFERSDLGGKTRIAEHVLPLQANLLQMAHGKFVLQNMSISLFRENKEKWERQQSYQSTKRRAFEEILGAPAELKEKPQHPPHRETERSKSQAPTPSKQFKDFQSYSHNYQANEKKRKRETFDPAKQSLSSKIMDVDHHPKSAPSFSSHSSHSDTKSHSETKPKRTAVNDESESWVDSLFDSIPDRPATKKSKTKENGSSSKSNIVYNPVTPTQPSPLTKPPQAQLSKAKMKKLAKAEKAAKRAADATRDATATNVK